MKHFTTFALLLLLAAGCTTSNKPQRITVLTYNIHHCEGMDKKLDVARIASVISSVKADLVALQEVDNKANRTGKVDQCAEIAKLTKMHGYFGNAMDRDGGQYGNAVLSRYPIDQKRAIALPWKQLDKHEPRAAVGVRCRLDDRRHITFISTHLDHNGKDPDRVEQVKKINEAFASVAPAILAGDMNATPNSEPAKILREQWTDSTGLDAAPTVPVAVPKAKIDYVMFKPAQQWKVIETKVLDETVASDHRAFLAVLELQPIAKP